MRLDRAVVFDVGRVLVDFSFNSFQAFLLERGAAISTKPEFYEKTNLYDFERGEISGDDFLTATRNLLTIETSKDEIKTAWVNIFSPINEMLEFCKEISKKSKTYILSNTNILHWEYLNDTYDLNSLTLHPITSFEEREMKPDQKIYESLEKKALLEPKNIFFIDDLKENIQAAKDRGWNGIVHKKTSETKDQVLQFLR